MIIFIRALRGLIRFLCATSFRQNFSHTVPGTYALLQRRTTNFSKKPGRAITPDTNVRLRSVHGEKKKKREKNHPTHRGMPSFSPSRRGRPSLHNYATHVRPCRGNTRTEHAFLEAT